MYHKPDICVIIIEQRNGSAKINSHEGEIMSSKNKFTPRPLGVLGGIIGTLLLLMAMLGVLLYYDLFYAQKYTVPQKVIIYEGEYIRKRMTNDVIFSDGGEALINIEAPSSYFGYGISGDSRQKTIVFEKGGYASFSAGPAAVVNGNPVLLSENTVMRGGKLYVPISFFEEYVSGLRFIKDEKNIKIDIGIGNFYIDDASLGAENAISVTDWFDAVGTGKTAHVFKTDLTAYEEYMNPTDRDKYLILINYESKLDKNYAPERLTDLVNTRKDGRATQQMELYAAKAMEAMMKEAAACGYGDLSITSAYRSFAYQQLLFDNQVSALRSSYGDKAEEKAAEAVAIPGTSEHQSGLCADLHNLPAASQAFANQQAYKWLVNNCSKFGYILRYPKDKTDITKIMFEPWHYRYVGRYHAERITQGGYCLEEYMDILGDDYFSGE